MAPGTLYIQYPNTPQNKLKKAKTNIGIGELPIEKKLLDTIKPYSTILPVRRYGYPSPLDLLGTDKLICSPAYDTTSWAQHNKIKYSTTWLNRRYAG